MTIYSYRKLIRLIEDALSSPTISEGFATEYCEGVRKSFVTQFTPAGKAERNNEAETLRVSKLGKPAVLQALGVLGYHEDEYAYANSGWVFHMGDVFEALVGVKLKDFGLSVAGNYDEVEFEGVKGHVDWIVYNEGRPTIVLEVKTMSEWYAKTFVAKPNDDRGYITQLAVYSYCLKIPGIWVVLNKGTNEVSIVEPPKEPAMSNAIKRARNVIECCRKIKTEADIFEYFEAPQPVPSLRKGKETGLYLVPPSMRYSKYMEVFYTCEKSGNTIYVTEVNSPEVALSRLAEFKKT